MRGVVRHIRPVICGERLKVVARVRTRDGGEVDAFLPDREVAALLPRSVLLGNGLRAPRNLLESLSPIIERFTGGREVRLWKYGKENYFSFLSWRSVRFT